MGNGGDDTYVIGSNNTGGKVAGGTALEYGDVSSTGGLLNSEGDSVNFADIDSITELDFVEAKTETSVPIVHYSSVKRMEVTLQFFLTITMSI